MHSAAEAEAEAEVLQASAAVRAALGDVRRSVQPAVVVQSAVAVQAVQAEAEAAKLARSCSIRHGVMPTRAAAAVAVAVAGGAQADSDAQSQKKTKKAKKEKKGKKSKKHKKEKKKTSSDSDDERGHTAVAQLKESVDQSQAVNTDDSDTKQQQQQQPLDVRSFFERIKAQEAGKETVGTVHASGFRAPNPTSLVAQEQWECVKRGCGQKNNKKAAACSKCGAMKRLSEWR